MNICRECGHKNHDHASRCAGCGRLSVYQQYATIKVDSFPLADLSRLDVDWKSGCGERQEVALFIPTTKRLPSYIFLQPGQRITLGRGDPSYDEQPDVDLSLYGAAEKGVSRIHAILEYRNDGVVVTDLMSTNGTYVNDRPLPVDQPHLLQDRDNLRVGNLVAHIIFQGKPADRSRRFDRPKSHTTKTGSVKNLDHSTRLMP